MTLDLPGEPYQPLSVEPVAETTTPRAGSARGSAVTVRTFDVFDTLIARRCIEPAAVFDIVGERAGMPGFRDARIAAERRVAARGAYGIDDIYAELASSLGLTEVAAGELRGLEITVEHEQVVPIAEHLAEVRDGDVLVSDMYLDPETVRSLLRTAGLDREVGVVVTADGKRSGTIWPELTRGLDIEEHLGDNERADGTSAQAAGIPSRLTAVSRPSEVEQLFLDHGLRRLAELCRELRLSTWSPDPTARMLQEIQAGLNVPLLVLASVRLLRTMAARGWSTALFSSRDCRGWLPVFEAVAAATGSEVRAEYFYTSRVARVASSPSYLDYARERLVPGAVVVDVCGTGSSLVRLAERLELPDIPSFLVHRIRPWAAHHVSDAVVACMEAVVGPDAPGIEVVALEMANYAEHGMVSDVIEVAGQFAPVMAEDARDEATLALVRAQAAVCSQAAGLLQGADIAELVSLGDAALDLMVTAVCQMLSQQGVLREAFHPAHRVEDRAVNTVLERAADVERRIGVVVPTYRGDDWLPDCLESLARQSLAFDRYEVVVVENGERGTAEATVARLAAEHPGLRIRHVFEETAGLSRARNVGIDSLTTPYVTFVDDDDRLAPGCLAALLEVARPDLVGGVLVGWVEDGDFEHPSLENRISSALAPHAARPAGLEDLGVMASYPWAKVVATDLARRVRFDETLVSGEDTVFWTTLIASTDVGLAVAAGTEPLYLRAVRAHSMMGYGESREWERDVRQRVVVLQRLEALRGVTAGRPDREAIRRRMVNAEASAFLGGYLEESPQEMARLVQTVRDAGLRETPWSLPADAEPRPVAPPPVWESRETPLLSVVMPTYDGAERLVHCLASLAAQTLPRDQFEVIVVENGPRTGAEDVVAAAGGGLDLVYRYTATAHVSVARNLGLDVARGDYVTFVDDDDRVGPRYLEELLAHAAPDVIAIAPARYVEDDDFDSLESDNYFLNTLMRAYGWEAPDVDLARCLNPTWGKVVLLEHARRVRFDEHLEQARDMLFWTTIATTTDLRLRATTLAEDASYVYNRRAGTISGHRETWSWERVIETRLPVLERVDALEVRDENAAEVRRALIDSMVLTGYFVPYLEQNPDDLDRMMAALRARDLREIPYDDLIGRRATALTLVGPGGETAVEGWGRVCDTLTLGPERTAAQGVVGLALTLPYDGRGWRDLGTTVQRALSTIAILEHTKGVSYRALASSSDHPLEHLLAAMVKLARPDLTWSASYPVAAVPAPRIPVEDDAVLQVLAAGLAAAGRPVREIDDMGSFARLVVEVLADDGAGQGEIATLAATGTV